MTLSHTMALAPAALFVFFMAQAGLSDLTTMKIRNRLVGCCLLAYVAIAPFSGLTLHEIGMSTAVAGAVLMVGLALFARGWIGGGDAKLAAVSALWLGADQTPLYLISAAVAGGLFALLILQLRTIVLPVALQSSTWVVRLHSQQVGVPYGVALALAAVFVLPQTHWLRALA